MSDQRTANVPFRKQGFYRLAALMAWNPAMAIFPRFREANSFNLLCLQSELCEIELELHKAIEASDTASDETSFYSSSLEFLRKHGKSSRQWELCLELREKLEKYNQAIISQIAIDKCANPALRDLKYLRRWLEYFDEEIKTPCDIGSMNWDEFKYGGRQLNDLLALSETSSRSDLLRHLDMPGRHTLAKVLQLEPSFLLPEENGYTYQMYGTAASITKIADTFVTLLASVLILVPIVVLHFIKNSNWRLGLIVAFTMTFTLVMALTSEAKRSEIFAAAAAFSAVQVVYVGGVSAT